MAATVTRPVEGFLCCYWEQGMEEGDDATLYPGPWAPGAPRQSSALIRLEEGDLVSVRSRGGVEIWRGILRNPSWPFVKRTLPRGWKRWFDLELPALLLERGHVPFWRQGRTERFSIALNSDRPGDVPARKISKLTG